MARSGASRGERDEEGDERGDEGGDEKEYCVKLFSVKLLVALAT
jgi:hypothetical protein